MLQGKFPKDKSIRDYLKFIEAHIWSGEALKHSIKVR